MVKLSPVFGNPMQFLVSNDGLIGVELKC
jgi:hypothetical protein